MAQESRTDEALAWVLAILLHLGVASLIVLSARWALIEVQHSAAGSPISATLQVSAADIRRAQRAIAAAAKPVEAAVPRAAPAPQPEPVPNPQTSDTPLQPRPQAPQESPDTVDQPAIDQAALLKTEQETQEQAARQRQEQVELTEQIDRQQEAERRQRLREQLEAIKRERAAAEKRTRLEEQRLRQLADLQSAAVARPQPVPPKPATGNHGLEQGLLARYIAALNATVRANWNTALAPELVRCNVRFTQIPGGEVIDIEFLDCPYDAQGRDSVERALRKTPMPYSGFESVFQRQSTLTMCYPEEACQ